MFYSFNFNVRSTVYACMLNYIWLFATLWTVTRQAPLSMGFPGKNTGLGCHFLLQGIFLTQGPNPCPLCLLHLQADSLPREAHTPGHHQHLCRSISENNTNKISIIFLSKHHIWPWGLLAAILPFISLLQYFCYLEESFSCYYGESWNYSAFSWLIFGFLMWYIDR